MFKEFCPNKLLPNSPKKFCLSKEKPKGLLPPIPDWLAPGKKSVKGGVLDV